MAAGLIASGASVDVVRSDLSPAVEDVLVVASLTERASAVDALNATDVVIIQHEYGLYDGADGDSIVKVIDAIDVPIVVVAHTVLSEPTSNQRDVLERVCAAADAIVVMTETARTRLFAGFDVDHAKVLLIPHGAATPPAEAATRRRPGDRPARLLTWGLLGPGKGIEWAIDAVSDLSDLQPPPEYIVAGATHPKVRTMHGEDYRNMLVARAAESGAAKHILFDD
ncbi:MAG: glycosyl transferase family 1, partial [Ilumatobacteraceae bacterium]